MSANSMPSHVIDKCSPGVTRRASPMIEKDVRFSARGSDSCLTQLQDGESCADQQRFTHPAFTRFKRPDPSRSSSSKHLEQRGDINLQGNDDAARRPGSFMMHSMGRTECNASESGREIESDDEHVAESVRLKPSPMQRRRMLRRDSTERRLHLSLIHI